MKRAERTARKSRKGSRVITRAMETKTHEVAGVAERPRTRVSALLVDLWMFAVLLAFFLIRILGSRLFQRVAQIADQHLVK